MDAAGERHRDDRHDRLGDRHRARGLHRRPGRGADARRGERRRRRPRDEQGQFRRDRWNDLSHRRGRQVQRPRRGRGRDHPQLVATRREEPTGRQPHRAGRRLDRRRPDDDLGERERRHRRDEGRVPDQRRCLVRGLDCAVRGHVGHGGVHERPVHARRQSVRRRRQHRHLREPHRHGLDRAAFAACTTSTVYTGLAEGAHTFRVRASDAGGADPTPASWTWTVLKSSNDAFAAAKPISGDRGSVHGTVLGATKETGEPNHGGQPGGTSVWYRWTAPASYRVQFDTEGSDFDTLLGVYTGGNVSALTTVVTDNDSGSYRISRVIFDAVAGTTYQLAVDKVYGSNDTFELRWAPYTEPLRPPNDDFANAQALTGAGGSVSGSNGGATKEPLEPVRSEEHTSELQSR